VAPLLVDDGKSAYGEISVVVPFQEATYIVSVAELAAIDARGLRAAVGDLRDDEDRLRRALDRVFTGF
ncbi:MAG: CcdB family protein, partial [Phenylobacterium sp.]